MNQEQLEAQLRLIKSRQVELLEKQAYYKRHHALEFFEPHPGQQPVVDAFLSNKYRTIAVLGGNRSGKTSIGAALVCSVLQGRLPWQPKPEVFVQNSLRIMSDGSLFAGGIHHENEKAYKIWIAEHNRDKFSFSFKKPVKIRIFGEDYEKAIGQVIIPYLEKFIPPELIASRKKNQAGVAAQWIMKDGSLIDLLTYQQDPSSMEGWDGDIVWFDEPPPRAVYIANVRGLIDRSGIALFTLTPLKEPWIANEIVNTADPKTFVHEINTHVNPHLKQSDVKDFEEKLSEEERETRIGGKFLHLQGLVFKEFNKQIHLRERFKIPANYTVYVAIDTHPRTKQALLFLAVDQKSRYFVFHEIFEFGTPLTISEWIIDFHNNIHKVHQVIIEPASQGDQNRGDSTFQIIDRELASHHIPLTFGSKDLSGGILQVREAFLSSNGLPSLFIFNDCQRVIWELQNYVWKEWIITSAKQAKNEQNKPRDADDHMVENLRRIIQFPARFMDPMHQSNLLAQANAPYRPSDEESGY